MSSFSEETEQCLTALQQRLEHVIQHYQQLSAQHQALLANCTQLEQERAALTAQNEQFRSRIDAMVVRLKAMGVS